MSQILFQVKFALRNVLRSTGRSIILIGGIATGTCFIITLLNFSRSGMVETKKKFLDHFSGERVLTRKNFYSHDRKKFDRFKTISPQDSDFYTDFPKSSRRILFHALAAGPDRSRGVLVVGVEPDRETRLTTLPGSISVGNFLSPTNPGGIILGRSLALRLGVQLGSEVALIGQALDGSVANELFTLEGILDLGGGDLETKLALIDLKDAQVLFAFGDRFHERVFFTGAETIKAPDGFEILSWEDLLPEVALSMHFSEGFLWLVALILALFVSLSLANTFSVSFLERDREFQIITVIGARSSWILGTLAFEVLIVSLIGIGLGEILAYSIGSYLSQHPIDMQTLNGGKTLLLGGMKIEPLVRVTRYPANFPLTALILTFLFALSSLGPLKRALGRLKKV